VIFEAIRMDSEYILLRDGPDGIEAGGRRWKYPKSFQVVSSTLRITGPSSHPEEHHGKGRGGATYDAFKLEENWKDLPVEKRAGSSADYWSALRTSSTG